MVSMERRGLEFLGSVPREYLSQATSCVGVAWMAVGTARSAPLRLCWRTEGGWIHECRAGCVGERVER